MKVAIVIPAYNEELTIAEVMAGFHRAAPHAVQVVIDNNSSDGTRRLAEQTLARLGIPGVVLFEGRQGKANAVRKALREVDADVYVMVDADCTYPAEALPALLAPVLAGEADMVVGDRLTAGAYAAQNRRAFHGFGNELVRRLINVLFRARLHDIMSGYRVFSRHFVENYPIQCEGFELETEMTLHALDKRFRVVEVPIAYGARPEGSFSKLRTYSDGLRVLRIILSIFRDYRPLAFFGWVAVVSFLAGLAFGVQPVLEFVRFHYVFKVPSFIMAIGLVLAGMLLFAVGLVLETVVKLHRFDFEWRLNQARSALPVATAASTTQPQRTSQGMPGGR
jgi:glycosyltransferase involved in cell wall biosynthesis